MAAVTSCLRLEEMVNAGSGVAREHLRGCHAVSAVWQYGSSLYFGGD